MERDYRTLWKWDHREFRQVLSLERNLLDHMSLVQLLSLTLFLQLNYNWNASSFSLDECIRFVQKWIKRYIKRRFILSSHKLARHQSRIKSRVTSSLTTESILLVEIDHHALDVSQYANWSKISWSEATRTWSQYLSWRWIQNQARFNELCTRSSDKFMGSSVRALERNVGIISVDELGYSCTLQRPILVSKNGMSCMLPTMFKRLNPVAYVKNITSDDWISDIFVDEASRILLILYFFWISSFRKDFLQLELDCSIMRAHSEHFLL